MDSSLFSFNQIMSAPRATRNDSIRLKIFDAIRANDVETLKQLLPTYSEINLVDEHDYTPLLVAAQTPYSHIIDLLIQHGANPNIRNSFDGNPLSMAITYKHLATIEALIRGGAEINLKNTQFDINILNTAVNIADTAIICALIKGGAHVDYPFFRKIQKKAFKKPDIFQPVLELLLTNEQIATKAKQAQDRVANLYTNELNPEAIQYGPLEKDLYTQQLQWMAKFVLRHPNNCQFYEENNEVFVKIKELKINLSQLLTQSDLSHIALSQKDNLLFTKLCNLSQEDITTHSTV